MSWHQAERRRWFWLASILASGVVLAVVIRQWAWSFAPGIPSESDEVVIRYMAWGVPQQIEIEREVIAAFNDKMKREGQRVRVELCLTPSSGYSYKLTLMLASGTAPDVMRVDHYQFPSLASRHYFKPLDDLIAADSDFKIDDFHAVVLKEGRCGGKLYGLNVLFGGVICYYNRDLFARAGLEDPHELFKRGQWTWAEFDKACKVLTQVDRQGRPVQYGFAMPMGNWPWMWAIFVWRYGGDLLSEDRARCVMDSPEAIAGMKKFHEIRWKYSPTPNDTYTGGYTFDGGKVAMEFTFVGMMPKFRDNIRDFRWDCVPTPRNEDGSQWCLVKGNQLAMSAACAHPRQAWEWMKFLTSEETEMRLYGDRLRRGVPTRKALLTRGDYLHAGRMPFNTDTFPYLLVHARELPIDATWPMWSATAQNSVDTLLQERDVDVEKLMKTAAAAATETIAAERVRTGRRGE